MNESINPLFIAGIVSFPGKPYTRSMQKPSAAPRCSLAQEGGCLLLLNVFLLFERPGWPWPSTCRLLFLLSEFCCQWAPSTAAPQRAVSPVSPELCPRSLCRTPVWAGGTATRGHARQPMTTAPAILNPLFITRVCFYPRYRADLLLACWF